MKEYGIERPKGKDIPDGSKKDWWRLYPDVFTAPPKGRSTLNAWVCPECGLKVRLGIKGDPELIHSRCSEERGNPVFLVRKA